MLKMGFFGKKKSRQTEAVKTNTSSTSLEKATRPGQAVTDSHSHPRRHSGQGKSVRFASAVSDDEGGFMTDSEVEINRATRHGSLRLRGERTLPSAVKPTFLDRTSAARPSPSTSHVYTERQPSAQQPTSPGLWKSNGTSTFHSKTPADDDYMSDASTASSFTRGSRSRSSLPILRNYSGVSTSGLVFLTYQNETVKTPLLLEIRELATVKAMFLRAFPNLNMDTLNSPKRKFYILDRPSNKFYLLVHLHDVRDGTMLKLVDSEAPTPSSIRKSRSAHTALSSDSIYFSEPEFDVDTTSAGFRGRRPFNRMALTKETNIDELPHSWSYHGSMPSQPLYLNTTEPGLPSTSSAVSTPPSSQYMTPNVNSSQTSKMPSTQLVNGSAVARSTPDVLVTDSAGLLSKQAEVEIDTHSSKDSTVSNEVAELNESAERNRMAKMEAQIANLTAWVQTALSSRPSSCTSDRISEFSCNSIKSKAVVDYSEIAKMIGLSGTSSCTPQPEISAELRKRIVSAAHQVTDLKTEMKQLRRIHEAQAESIQETIKDSFTKIQNAVANIPGAKRSPLRNQRTSIDVNLDAYKAEQSDALSQISALEACVSELRTDVVSKRCHVNMAEVEALALKLSKATRKAADMKSKFPKLTQDLTEVLHNEMENVLAQQQFLSKEPENIEDTLRRCKSITNVLFTLKRLAAIDTHRAAVVPKIRSKPVQEGSQKQLLKDIQSIHPSHTDRVRAIQSSEQSVARKRDILQCDEMVKLDTSLELASVSLKDADSSPRVDIDRTKLDNMIAKAKTSSLPKNGVPSSSKENGRFQSSNVIRRNKQRVDKSQFYQNRDSIHWDAETDSDCSESSNSNNPTRFVDVTEAPVSAFSVVQPQNSLAARNNTHFSSNSTSLSVSQPANGKIYQAPSKLSQGANQHKSSQLQEQYQKLQEMQRHFRSSPCIAMTATTNTPTSSSIRPMAGALNASFITPTSSRSSSSCSSGKPAVAPKPQLHANRLLNGKNLSLSEGPDPHSTTV